MPISEALLEISEYHGAGYRSLVDYEAWRVALLRYIDELLPHNITAMQRHDGTDEVFVLLAGHCILFLGEGAGTVEAIHAQDMQPFKLYNVKKSAWHTHTLSQDAAVLIVENQDTSHANSPSTPLTAEQKSQLVSLTSKLWGT